MPLSKPTAHVEFKGPRSFYRRSLRHCHGRSKRARSAIERQSHTKEKYGIWPVGLEGLFGNARKCLMCFDLASSSGTDIKVSEPKNGPAKDANRLTIRMKSQVSAMHFCWSVAVLGSAENSCVSFHSAPLTSCWLPGSSMRFLQRCTYCLYSVWIRWLLWLSDGKS